MTKRPTQIDDEHRQVTELLRSFDTEPAPARLHRRVEALVAERRGARCAGRASQSPSVLRLRVCRRRRGGRRGGRVRARNRPRRQRRLSYAEPAPGGRANTARRDAVGSAREQGKSRPARRRGRRRAVPLLGGPLRLAQHRDAQRPGRRTHDHDGLLLRRAAAGGSATRSSPGAPRRGSTAAWCSGAAACPTGCSPSTARRQ